MKAEFYQSDPMWSAQALHSAARKNYDGVVVGFVVEACEVLRTCERCGPGGWCASCMDLKRDNLTLVRGALRWALTDINSRTWREPETEMGCHTVRGLGGAVYRHQGPVPTGRMIVHVHHEDQPLARRVANVARGLPNPQPMRDVNEDCEGHVFLSGDADYGWEKQCAHVVHEPDGWHCGYPEDVHEGPAPTHALRLYIDALQLAKGQEWFDWLWGFAPQREDCYAERSTWIRFVGVLILRDGTIEGVKYCPPLPELPCDAEAHRDTLG